MSQTQKYLLPLAYHLSVIEFVRRRGLSAFGHIARLTQGAQACSAIHCQVGLASDHSVGQEWRRHPGRPRASSHTNSTMTLDLFLSTSEDRLLRGHGGVT